MSGEMPYFIIGKIVEVMPQYNVAYVKVDNGNVYNLTPKTPGINFRDLKKGMTVECEITSMLIRVLSARILHGQD